IDDESTQQVTFITDMGRENANTYVKDFFKQFKNIDIKYAQRDIPYSNCMIERFNMDLKYMYLYRDTIKSYSELNQLVAHAVREHNYTKRLGILNGQTPYEVYNGISPNTEWINERWEEAKALRKRKAKKTICCLTKL
ncbi:MAG: transposase, partial [Bacteroidetes bacterium]|nr:transposase [Bacteroidota bacterium]